MPVTFTLNGAPVTVDATPGTPILWVLRDDLELTGTKFGCGVAACGACTVHVNGEAVRGCQTPVDDLEGAEIVTIEGLNGKVGDALRQAWTELAVVQCGYCQSGQIMQAAGLLSANARPTVEEIEAAMEGNACRCATYQRIRAAVVRASELLEA